MTPTLDEQDRLLLQTIEGLQVKGKQVLLGAPALSRQLMQDLRDRLVCSPRQADPAPSTPPCPSTAVTFFDPAPHYLVRAEVHFAGRLPAYRSMASALELSFEQKMQRLVSWNLVERADSPLQAVQALAYQQPDGKVVVVRPTGTSDSLTIKVELYREWPPAITDMPEDFISSVLSQQEGGSCRGYRLRPEGLAALHPAGQPAPPQAMTQMQLAEAVGCSESTIRNWAKRANVHRSDRAHSEPYTQEDVRRILEYGRLYSKGRSPAACRRMLGLS